LFTDSVEGSSPQIALCCVWMGCQLATLPTLSIVTLFEPLRPKPDRVPGDVKLVF